MDFRIETWTPVHQNWQELVALIAAENQTHWALNAHFERFSRHFLVALQETEVIGFLMFVVWEIGLHDRDHPALQLNGETLTEAKIIAFGVQQDYRRQGIGRVLQKHVIDQAKKFGCFQVRSVSGGEHAENYQLKLSMGFAVEPMERDEKTVAFIMPLRLAPLRLNGSDTDSPSGRLR